MNEKSEYQQPLHQVPLSRRALQGGIIALVLILTFLLSTGVADPDWPKFWYIRPLLTVSAAGALGGILYYFLDHLRRQGSWKTGLANILSLLGYIVLVWLGTVAGLAGTMWD